jgi:FtsP/CotA-like multicopper oxidase with cupredoxin domain
MQSNGARLGIAAAAIAVLVVLFVVLSGGDDDSSSSTVASTTTTTTEQNGTTTTTTEAAVPTITIKDGEPVGGIQDLSFDKGDDIRFKVTSDADWEIHFHGYDIPMDVKAGGSVEFNVPATIEGVFEVEIEQTATQIAEITVNP